MKRPRYRILENVKTWFAHQLPALTPHHHHWNDPVDAAHFDSELAFPGAIPDEATQIARYEFAKRAFDLAFSIPVVLLVLPLGILIALLIRMDSSGPVIFRQRRIGQNRRKHSIQPPPGPDRRRRDLRGQPVYIYKFRTMVQSARRYARKPRGPRDKRLTRVGRFLRSTCLDELPQFINVIKGDMSVVGPRPEMPFIVRNYNHFEAQRLRVRPGITGLWQLQGSREKEIHEEIQYDLIYIQHRSLLRDLRIILRTIAFVSRFRNV